MWYNDISTAKFLFLTQKSPIASTVLYSFFDHLNCRHWLSILPTDVPH